MQFFLTAVGVVLLSVASSLGVYYYMSHENVDSKDATVNVQVQEAIEQVTDPVMLSVEEILQVQHDAIEYEKYDSLFKAMPQDVLINIAQVVIGKQHRATRKDIAEEFYKHYKPVYQYIKPQEQSTLSSTNNQVKNDSLKERPLNKSDTIINGKVFQLVKEGRTANE